MITINRTIYPSMIELRDSKNPKVLYQAYVRWFRNEVDQIYSTTPGKYTWSRGVHRQLDTGYKVSKQTKALLAAAKAYVNEHRNAALSEA